jgi:hypothetical protein
MCLCKHYIIYRKKFCVYILSGRQEVQGDCADFNLISFILKDPTSPGIVTSKQHPQSIRGFAALECDCVEEKSSSPPHHAITPDYL